MKHSPLAIANAIVSIQPGRTAMAVNKLVHLIHGWSLANGQGIVSSEAEIWRFGPVYRDVFEAFENFGHDGIGVTMPFRGTLEIPSVPSDDEWAWNMIVRIVDAYRNVDACGLSDLCHAMDSPWRRVAERNDFRVPVGTTIPEADMFEHFRRQGSIAGNPCAVRMPDA